MTTLAWIYVLIGAALIVAAAPYGFARTETARRKAVDRLAKRIDLAVPTSPIEDERVGLRLAVRERFIAVGGGIGLIVAILAALFLPAFGRNDFTVLGIFLIALTGIGVGAGLSALRTTRELPSDVPRIARLSSPTIHDYLIPIEYRGAIGAVVLGVVVTIATLPLGFTWDQAILPIAVAAAAVVALVAALLLARSILDRGQRAGSVLELAWDDAIRAIALRDLMSVPLALGFASALVPLVTLISDVRLVQPYDSPGNMLALGAMGLVGLFAFVGMILAIVALASNPQRHYRRRLWATPAGNTAPAAPTTAASTEAPAEGDVR
ncbi:hypothetical protein [Labedella endophytica]|uniref:Uncharacterized protein n=1 Tax=Labedella endophytica TaxID=1523160 RepID=A0A3S0VHA6_9MICO|nr:hypothetical protein [Labedella endophytica]RUR01900.1 hypothetical protein ELQ94_10670 [Labedella endophytica]